ncbi:CDC45 [Branchiostoma lanceolatum]|uniref:CDC45 protein n=1 Tax=Branchiostoma lanceolatum TaxID=7740 RepID=A0A8J9VDI9_BRALA|nr:CDC45 [Branchiostoma lanceolatum]
MFVNDIRKEFYDKVVHERVLVLVAFDVDALCACKILQYLFQCDHVQYTIVPITGRQELETAFLEHSEQVKYVVMINCGGNINILETLQPAEHVIFFIADSHRPVDLVNVYNDDQVKLLMPTTDDFDIPAYDDLFKDDESDDDSGNESDSSAPSGKRRRLDEEVLERRRERRLWEEKRKQILLDYEEFSTYGTSSAMIMFDLAWKMSKDSNDLLWWGIVGLTDQYINNRVERGKYMTDVGDLHKHTLRLNHRNEDDDNTVSVDCIRIYFDEELKLALYRHWSLFESLKHSSYPACKFKMWTVKGQQKMHEFLADMGLPLVQVKQKFTSMDMGLKESFKGLFTASCEKYGLDDISFGSFIAQYGYKNKLCAADVVYAVNGLMECVEAEKSPTGYFLEALDCLSRQNVKKLLRGLDLAKRQLTTIMQTVHSFIDMKQIISAGPFLYAYIPEGHPDAKFFSRPNCLGMLAYFMQEAYVATSRSRRSTLLPMVVAAPLNAETGSALVIGIPPKAEESTKNFFGRAFEQAAIQTNSRTLHDNFDTSIIEMKSEDRSKFFDALISLLS